MADVTVATTPDVNVCDSAVLDECFVPAHVVGYLPCYVDAPAPLAEVGPASPVVTGAIVADLQVFFDLSVGLDVSTSKASAVRGVVMRLWRATD